MLLLFSFVSPTDELRTHSIFCRELEELLDLLNTFVAADYQLVSVALIDKGSRMELPIEVFDGTSIRDAIRTLQQQYELILSAYE